jgi:outer membrane protein OmpA-like peptidoglycan-associated protein
MTVLFGLTVLVVSQGPTHAAPATEKPLYEITVVQTPAQAINYRNLKGSVEIDFKGTVLLPQANGVADIKNKAGRMKIEAKFENLAPAARFGPEYLTYVLWAISPDGRATNLGELLAETPLQALSLLVTAEPYFAVSQPSEVVVLENAIKPGNDEDIQVMDASFELLPRGQYTKNMSATDLHPQVMDRKTPFSVYQARNAVRIAKAAGAEAYAADGFKDAERLLALSETREGGKKGRAMTARRAIQTAEASRLIAVKRRTDETLAKEQRYAQDQINSAETRAAAARDARVEADDARIAAEQARRQSDSERASALALAASAAASSTNAQAEAKAARAAADDSKKLADLADSRAQQAEGEQVIMRARLLQQLNSVLQTRDTARGLIVNMSDALFETGSSTLRPAVREKLAKVAGIVSSQSGLKLEVEGHTDSVGSDESNQRLSERRAQVARDYLVNQGVPAVAIASRGFGETVPIKSNDTAQGRQENRRVEIVVSGDAIGRSGQNL